MKKSIITSLLIVVMSMFGAKTFAHDIAVKNADGVTIYYIWRNNNTELAVSYRGDNIFTYDNEYDGNVVIPELVEYNSSTYRVTSIDRYAFCECSGLNSVTIPNGVKSIGEKAFDGCSALTSITISNSVTSIGDWSFNNCKGLTSVTIPNNVISISNYVFSGCSGLISVIIPNSLTSIGDGAFSGCSSLNSVTIPNSLTSIGVETFQGCSGLTSMIIPNNVTTIGNYAFYGCSGLSSLTIGENVISIGASAFKGCSNLFSVTIPNNVTFIGSNAFSGCGGLTSVTISSNVTYIGQKVFSFCKKLTDVFCYAEIVPETEADAFNDSNIEYSTLHVPTAAVDSYREKWPWSAFKSIVTLNGDTPGDHKCAIPTISVVDGKLSFSCETEDVEYHYTISNNSPASGVGNDVPFSQKYTITVYASKSGYENSDTATAEITATVGLTGDANGDGVVNAADVVKVTNIIMGE